MRDPKRTPKFWTDISKGINELAGGSDQTFGSFQGLLGDDPLNYSEDQDVKWDISGNQMRHVIRSILGGVYDFGEDGVMTALDIVGNDPDRFNDIPVLSRFYKGSTHGGKTRTKFYSLKDNVGQADAHLRAAEKSDNPTKYVREAKEQHKTILKYSESVSNLDKAKRKMSRATKKVENDPTMTDWEKTQRVANLEATWLSLAAKIINKAQADGIRL
jgi:hypothetical protein